MAQTTQSPPPAPLPFRASYRLGTRGSRLARMQTDWVIGQLKQRWPGIEIELVQIISTGDKIQDRPLHEVGGKGLFTRELEQALIDRRVDIAVHSSKDMPVTQPLVDISSLAIAAVPGREDCRDALISRHIQSLHELKPGQTLGTSSLRRMAQALAICPGLKIMPLRGNVDTRLRKLNEGQFDAIILAVAGLKRAELWDGSCMHPIDSADMLPSAGQGALALQCRGDDADAMAMLGGVNDPTALACLLAERQIVTELQGDCHSPIAALAKIRDGVMHLQAAEAQADGHPPVRRQITGPACDALILARDLAKMLRADA